MRSRADVERCTESEPPAAGRTCTSLRRSRSSSTSTSTARIRARTVRLPTCATPKHVLTRINAVRQKAKDITNLLLDEKRMRDSRKNRANMNGRLQGDGGERPRSSLDQDRGGRDRGARRAQSVPTGAERWATWLWRSKSFDADASRTGERTVTSPPRSPRQRRRRRPRRTVDSEEAATMSSRRPCDSVGKRTSAASASSRRRTAATSSTSSGSAFSFCGCKGCRLFRHRL